MAAAECMLLELIPLLGLATPLSVAPYRPVLLLKGHLTAVNGYEAPVRESSLLLLDEVLDRLEELPSGRQGVFHKKFEGYSRAGVEKITDVPPVGLGPLWQVLLPALVAREAVEDQL